MRLMPSILFCGCLFACATASADDLLGVYVGAGVGESTLLQDYYQVDAHATGWKLLAGWRPLTALGAEVEYADLGSKNVSYVNPAGSTQISTDAHATSLFALGYLPVPMPWLDLYVKAGAARVQDNTKSQFTGSIDNIASAPIVTDSSRTSFAWGAGLQFKFGLPAVRVEYERFDGSQGNDSLLTAALTLNF
jgi:opacity protein-like surface antigen